MKFVEISIAEMDLLPDHHLKELAGSLSNNLHPALKVRLKGALNRTIDVLNALPAEQFTKLAVEPLLSQRKNTHLKAPLDSLFFFSFIYEITQPRPEEGFVILTLIRSKGLKEKFGFKGSDHKLALRWIPAYHHWKRMAIHFLSTVVQECYRADYGLNVYWKGKGEAAEPVFIPPQLIAIMMSPNPGNWIKASQKAIEEFVGGITGAYLHLVSNPEKISDSRKLEFANEVIPRIDNRLGANMMRHQRTVVKMIDVDSEEGIKYVEDSLKDSVPEYLDAGLPAIRTVHGYHIWIIVSLAEQLGVDGKRMGKLHKLLSPESVREAFGLDKNEPLPIEFKGKFQEPIPGIMYQKEDFAPKFGFFVS